jgi:soluble lytic murein transglycosylase-like protein
MEQRIERIMNKSNSKLSDSKKALYKQYIMKWANEYDLSPVFVAAMIHRETNFNESAVSKSNARGPMQVIYKYHKDKCDAIGISEKELHYINHGINIGCQVIRQYLDWNNWNYRAALKKYVGAVNNSADGYIDDIFKMTMYAYEI